MTRPRSRIGLAFLLILVAGVSPAGAASIVAGTTVLPGCKTWFGFLRRYPAFLFLVVLYVR